MELETVLLESLTLDPRNARSHERGIPEIAASLSEFGQQRNVVVWHDVVMAGNGVVEAARSLGWTQIEIAQLPTDWDYDRAQLYAIVDNKTSELSEWNLPVLSEIRFDLDAQGWEMERFGFEPLVLPVLDKEPDDFTTCPTCGHKNLVKTR